MQVGVTVNDSILDNIGNWQSTIGLLKRLSDSGYQVTVIHPSEVYLDGIRPIAKRIFTPEFSMEGDQILLNLNLYQENTTPNADLLFIRGLDERFDGVPSNPHQFDFYRALRDQSYIQNFLNHPESEEMSMKTQFPKLSGPIIPSFLINSPSELESVLKQEEKLVVKQDNTFRGLGVDILSWDDFQTNPEKFKEYFSNPSRYLFQTFIDSYHEKRLIFLGGELLWALEARRWKPWELASLPRGTVRTKGRGHIPYEPTQKELNIAHSMVDQVGFEFGCVDFLGEYVVEINGSGTSTAINLADGSASDLGDRIVYYIGKKYGGRTTKKESISSSPISESYEAGY